ncbi:MAG: hypothetical protein PVH21_11365 [Myxococcales bacterium]
MFRLLTFALCLLALWACGGDGTATNPGPLVDNTLWVPSDEGEAIFGPAPADSQCLLTPQDCEEYYPWPEGECVPNLAGSSCIASYVPECYDTYTVLSVYTRMPDERFPLCNWLTLQQPSLRDVRAGDRIEVRAYHFALTEPLGEEARMSFVIGDELVFDETILIPRDGEFLTNTWTAPKDYPAGTPVLWHVNNHGSNEYLLVEVNVLE